MPLVAGARLGPYEIVSALGAGGMGEVYRARDTKLGREVAIKVLPEALAFDPDRIARFEREAKVLASLNHPHVAALYGMEQFGDRHFLVLELVEGETLAERLRRGAMPVEEVLTVAQQIADALEAAHEKGIVHRDLKPANVKITPDEKVKVLDFGLAKALDPAGVAQDFSPANITQSPTLSMMATQAGVILGTAAYMSPEQAKGLPADRRSDVFSFGCVLYEMLTGHQPFRGETAPDILASVLAREPDLTAMPPNLNPRIAELLRRCLEKNPKRRWQAVGDLRAEIETIATTPRAAAPMTVRSRPEALWRRLAFVGVPALVVGAGIAGASVWLMTRPEPPRVSRLLIAPASDAAVTITGPIGDLAITPDGTRVVYAGANDRLFVRALDALDATAITGLGRTDSGADGTLLARPRARIVGPFVSPDGEWIAFSTGASTNTLQKVPITGGPSVTLAQLDEAFSGGTWSPDDTIVFATTGPETGLRQMPAGGGTPVVLTRPNRSAGEADHVFPEILPGGQAVLFTIRSTRGLDQAQVAVLDLRTKTQTTLIRGGSHAHYVTSGHLVYGAAGTLHGVAFDLRRLAVVGTPVPVVPDVIIKGSGAVEASVAGDGTLVYVPGVFSTQRRSPVWVDRLGREEAPITGEGAMVYGNPRLSPDGTRVAVEIRNEETDISDIWILDIARKLRTRITFDPVGAVSPVWTTDSRRVLFSSGRAGVVAPNIFALTADGTGTVERLTHSPSAQYPRAISPDGTRLVFEERSGLMMLTLNRELKVQPLVQTPFTELNAEISPNGRWLAYESNESGSYEIYVRPFPDVDSRRELISVGGGTRPLWARTDQELFYVAPSGALMSVPIETGSTWKAGPPAKLFDWPLPAFGGRSYDVSADGQKFLLLKLASTSDQDAAPSSLVVIQHFDEELKRLVPVGN